MLHGFVDCSPNACLQFCDLIHGCQQGSSQNTTECTLCRGQITSLPGGHKPNAVAIRGIHEAITGCLNRSELRLFLEYLAYTAEGILSLSFVASSIGVAHPTASLRETTSAVVAQLRNINEVDVQTIATPYRYIIHISMSPDGNSSSKCTRYSVGLLLKSGGLALVQFNKQQFDVQKHLQDKVNVRRLEAQKEGSQSAFARMGTIREVPRYQELVKQLTDGPVPLACMVSDVGAAWHADASTASDVTIAQKNLNKGIEEIAKFLSKGV
jgi:hypothetical protein